MIGAAALALLLCAAPVRGESVADWSLYIAEASARFGVPTNWLERVMRAESGGRTRLHGRPITSPVGAIGLMQIMPATWAELRVTHRLGDDPRDPRANILAGAAYLRAMYDRFGYPGLFAAYNAGPARYADYLAGRRALPAETRAYLVAVAGNDTVTTAGQTPSAPQRSGLFFTLSRPASPATPAAAEGPGVGLFAIPPRPRTD